MPLKITGKRLYSTPLLGSLEMALVKIRYFGILREISRKKEEDIEIDNSSTALDLIEIISSKNGPKFRNFVFEKNGKLNEGLAFAVNGYSIDRSKLSKTKCYNITEFVILPPISGGRMKH
ncbi:MAG: MoaD/ThiS family protein [Thaumarchaeota archaeon]|nr:MoaD/ThiS family protein [Nitrososphaerota archaeon]